MFLCGTLHAFIVHDTRILRDMFRHATSLEKEYTGCIHQQTHLSLSPYKNYAQAKHTRMKVLNAYDRKLNFTKSFSSTRDSSFPHILFTSNVTRQRNKKNYVCIRSTKTWFSNENKKLKRNMISWNVWENTISFPALFGKSTQNVCRRNHFCIVSIQT